MRGGGRYVIPEPRLARQTFAGDATFLWRAHWCRLCMCWGGGGWGPSLEFGVCFAWGHWIVRRDGHSNQQCTHSPKIRQNDPIHEGLVDHSGIMIMNGTRYGSQGGKFMLGRGVATNCLLTSVEEVIR